ncbi:AMP-binding protein [Pseudomonas aeruginosa]
MSLLRQRRLPDGADPRRGRGAAASAGTPLYQADALEDCAARAEDIACFQLSGGTTGTPELIPRRHREYLYNVRASAEVCGFDEATRCTSPACRWRALHSLLPRSDRHAVLAGGRVVVSQRADPEHCFALIARERVTHTALVPPLAMLWLDAQESRRADLSSLRLLQVGGLQARQQCRATRRTGARLPVATGAGNGRGADLLHPPGRSARTRAAYPGSAAVADATKCG